MTVTTFYASSPITGIALGNSDVTTIVPILTLQNPSSNATSVAIQKLYWTYISGTLGRCSLVWIESIDNSSLVGKFITGAFGDSVNIVTFNENISSTCAASLQSPITNFSVIRPSNIILSNTINTGIESINGELLVYPGHTISIGAIGSIGIADKSMLTLVWEESPSGPVPPTGSFLQNQQLVGVKNSVNTIFTTTAKFLFNGIYCPTLYVNGIRQIIPTDYFVAEGAGPGTGFDTIIFIVPPLVSDNLTIDYFLA